MYYLNHSLNKKIIGEWGRAFGDHVSCIMKMALTYSVVYIEENNWSWKEKRMACHWKSRGCIGRGKQIVGLQSSLVNIKAFSGFDRLISPQLPTIPLKGLDVWLD